jgi:hypothetical protein
MTHTGQMPNPKPLINIIWTLDMSRDDGMDEHMELIESVDIIR